MRVTISSGIGSLLSVMASHVRRTTKYGADALPHHLVRATPHPCVTPFPLVASSRTESGSDFNFNIPRSSHPPGHPARTALALGLARQQHPVNNLAAPELPPLRLEAASLQGRVQILVKSGNILTGLGVDEYLTRDDGAGARSFLVDALGST